MGGIENTLNPIIFIKMDINIGIKYQYNENGKFFSSFQFYEFLRTILLFLISSYCYEELNGVKINNTIINYSIKTLI